MTEVREETATVAWPAGPPVGDRNVTFLQDPIVDNLLRSVVTLTMELSVTRERLSSLERVLDLNGIPVSQQIDSFVPTTNDDAVRRAERERLIQWIVAPIVDGLSGKS